MTREEITALFLRRQDALNRHDVAGSTALFAEDCVVESPTAGGVVKGLPTVDAIHRAWFTAFPDVVFATQDLLIDGDHVAWIVRAEGTDTGGFMGLPPTGKAFELPMVMLATLTDRRIVHERRIYDVTGMTRLYREALERAKLEQELQMAASIQQALLPVGDVTGGFFTTAGTSMPCRAVGGDFFDYLDRPGGPFGFVLGDVAGKGSPAALLAAAVLGMFSAEAGYDPSPGALMARLNDGLLRRHIEARFVTAFYGVLAPDGSFTYSNAGHNPPMLVTADGVRRLDTGGLVLGFAHGAFDEETLTLQPGDAVVVFSDGMTEAFDETGAEFTDERLLAAVMAHRGQTPRAWLDALVAEVRAFCGRATPSDDLTMMVIRYEGRLREEAGS